MRLRRPNRRRIGAHRRRRRHRYPTRFGSGCDCRRGRKSDLVLRVTAENLNRLLGLAGESLVESRWLKPFAQSLLRLKRMHYDLGKAIDSSSEAQSEQAPADGAGARSPAFSTNFSNASSSSPIGL